MDRLVPYNFAQAITKSDTVDIAIVGDATPVRAVYVGGTGDVVAVFPNGATATFVAVPAGSILPICVKRINSASTSASAMLALYVV